MFQNKDLLQYVTHNYIHLVFHSVDIGIISETSE